MFLSLQSEAYCDLWTCNCDTMFMKWSKVLMQMVNMINAAVETVLGCACSARALSYVVTTMS